MLYLIPKSIFLDWLNQFSKSMHYQMSICYQMSNHVPHEKL